MVTVIDSCRTMYGDCLCVQYFDLFLRSICTIPAKSGSGSGSGSGTGSASGLGFVMSLCMALKDFSAAALGGEVLSGNALGRNPGLEVRDRDLRIAECPVA